MSTVDLAEIGNISDLLRQLTQGESLVVRSGGKDVGVLVATQDSRLLEVIEDYLDNQAADAALAEGTERIPYDLLRHELGLAE
jgi:antitoxin (DNA-binding transcriptional repressor) of toxin-antitoxin stability system